MASPEVPSPAVQNAAKPAALLVVSPSGSRQRVAVDPVPFRIGRQTGNHLVLHDNRISRAHAHIVVEDGDYWIEDLGSRHGIYINGEAAKRQKLRNSDRIDFGVQDCYKLTFTLEEEELHRILEQLQAPERPELPGAANLAKLRALMDVARALQNSLSTQDVLVAVVDAAVAITAAERGFMLLKRSGEDLEIAVARDRRGAPLAKTDLRVPTRLIGRALNQRRDLFSMNFDPYEREGVRPEMSVAELELRSVVCVPLVRIRAGLPEETQSISPASDTVGLLYLDSRAGAADLSSGNRELIQTLAIEASTILENARLLEEERAKQRMEEELEIARQIQHSLLPRHLPVAGYFRAAGSSIPSHLVGGDYFDVRPIHECCWSAVVADVSGKGVSSALLAALIQGAHLLAAESALEIEQMMSRINRFLNERTEGEKYATVFYCTVSDSGLLRWTNAGHCAPLLLRSSGEVETLRATGMPVGMLPDARYEVRETTLRPGEKIVIYSDGVSEARNADGEFFEARRIRQIAGIGRTAPCDQLHSAIMQAVEAFTEGAEQSDDITLLVLEYRP